jgi:hypothetical protein
MQSLSTYDPLERHAFRVVESTMPPDMTISEFRRAQVGVQPRPRRRWSGILPRRAHA